jgi:hypothetical protein
MQEQSLIIRFLYCYVDLDALHDLEFYLDEFLENNPVGRLDGHEIAMEGVDGLLFLYGPDAQKLFESIKPILLLTPFTSEAEIFIQNGENESECEEIYFIMGRSN